VSLYKFLLVLNILVISTSVYSQENIFRIIFNQDFEDNSVGYYDQETWNKDFNYAGWRDSDHRTPGWEYLKDSIIVDPETNTKTAKFVFDDTVINDVGGNSPARGGDYWRTNLGYELKEGYLSYNIKFKPGFDFADGVKLPATNGGSEMSKEHQNNLKRPQETDGWTSAIMVKPDGIPYFYLFYHGMSNDHYADSHYWNDYQPSGLNYTPEGNVLLNEEKWYNITIRVVCNSIVGGVANHDGIMEAYVDGKLVESWDGLWLINPHDINKGFNTIAFGMFFGGGSFQHKPRRDEWTYIDDVTVFHYEPGLTGVTYGNKKAPKGTVIPLPNLKYDLNPEDDQSPTVPTNISGTNITSNSLTLNWSNSSDNFRVNGYNVFQDGEKVQTTYTNSAIINGLTKDTEYSFQVTAFDPSYNESEKSEAITVKTLNPDTEAPSVPTGVTAFDITETSFKANWNSSSDNVGVRGYDVIINGSKLNNTTDTFYTVTGLSPGQKYDFQVSAYDDSWNSSARSSIIAVNTQSQPADEEPPTPPAGLDTTAVGENFVKLSWEASTDNEGVLGYRIYANGLRKGSTPNLYYTLDKLNSGVEYEIWVTAIDESANESDNSDSITVTTREKKIPTDENPDDEPDDTITSEVELEVPPEMEADISILRVINSDKSTETFSKVRQLGSAEVREIGIRVSENKDLAEGTELFVATPTDYSVNNDGRITSNLQVLYNFSLGSGSRVKDLSGSSSPLDLSIQNPSNSLWLPGQGLKVTGNNIIKTEQSPTRLLSALKTSGEVTIEAWIKPCEMAQTGPARIVSLSSDHFNRAFTLAQEGTDSSYHYLVRLNTTFTDMNGVPERCSEKHYCEKGLQHVVFTHSMDGNEALYLNGDKVYEGTAEGSFDNWSNDFEFLLANELTGERPWSGVYYLVAVYNSALNEEEVEINYNAGFGQVEFSTRVQNLYPNSHYYLSPFVKSEKGIKYGEMVSIITPPQQAALEYDTLNMKMYPNPSRGNFTLFYEYTIMDTKDAWVRIIDSYGRVVYFEELYLTDVFYRNEQVIELNESEVKNGIYLVTLKIGEKKMTQRLMIHR